MVDLGPVVTAMAAARRTMATLQQALAESERNTAPLRQALASVIATSAAIKGHAGLTAPLQFATQERLAASRAVSEALRSVALPRLQLELGPLNRIALDRAGNAGAALSEAIASARTAGALDLGIHWDTISLSLQRSIASAVETGGELDIADAAVGATEAVLSEAAATPEGRPFDAWNTLVMVLLFLVQLGQARLSDQAQSAKSDQMISLLRSIYEHQVNESELHHAVGLTATRPVYLRSEPSSEGSVVAKLNAGARLVVLRREGRWLYAVHHLEEGGDLIAGWVYKRNLLPVSLGEDPEENE